MIFSADPDFCILDKSWVFVAALKRALKLNLPEFCPKIQTIVSIDALKLESDRNGDESKNNQENET